MKDKQFKSIIESLLFYWGEPLDIKSISEIIGLNENKILNLINELKGEFESAQRGIQIKKIGKKYQFVTSPLNYKYIEQLLVVEDEKSLSDSAMETLSIIAYKQPV
ncbi:MAG: SMC-Scp complex subunit ScpB, partial [Tissierellia bacterium]|nr:SMC-Scp complex subunit ScpB [Tissierellia bacterium]